MEPEESIEFKRLVMPHVGSVEMLARRMLADADDIRDAMQEVLIRLWQSRSGLREVTNIRSYMLRVARNVCLDRIGQSGRFEPLEIVPEAATDETAADDLAEAEVMMGRLPENQRRALRLRGYGGMEVDEIAAEMKVSQANVRQLLSRGRRRLLELLKG